MPAVRIAQQVRMVVATYIHVIITVLLLINVKRLNDLSPLNVMMSKVLLKTCSSQNRIINKMLTEYFHSEFGDYVLVDL
jgi:hypothetical protein